MTYGTLGPDRAFDDRGRQKVGVRIDVDETRGRSRDAYGLGSCNEAVRRHYYLVAGPDAKRLERQREALCARGDADGFRRFAVGREFGLKLLDLAAEYERGAACDVLDRGEQLFHQRRINVVHPRQRNLHRIHG